MKRSLFLAAFWVVVLALALGLSAGSLSRGDLNQDEGWYLYAARMVSEGKLPYIDFASTQAPVMAFVYALAQPLVDAWGVAGGRFFTVILGFLAMLSAAWLASVLVPRERRALAASVALCLIGVNVYQSYFTAIVKTYSLAALWLTLGFVALAAVPRLRRAWPALPAGVLLALAAGTRVSAGAAVAAVTVVLVVAGWRGRKEPADGETVPWFGASILFILGAAVTLGAVFVPFAVLAPRGLWFALVEYHAGRQAGDWLHALIYKGGFVSRMTFAYFAALALGLFMLLGWLVRGSGVRAAGMGPWRTGPALAALWLGVLGITLVHVAAPFPYDDYQVMIFPLFAAGVAVAIGRAGDLWALRPMPDGVGVARDTGDERNAWKREMATLILVFLLCAGAAGSSPMLQDWVVGQRDRIWWPLKAETPLANLRRAAGVLRDSRPMKHGDVLLTQDLYLAVEAGWRVPEGLELGPFSYFPDWSTGKAKACRVMNREMMLNLLASCEAPVAAFSGYSLAIRCPEVAPLGTEDEQALWLVVNQRYQHVARVEGFGQAGTTLEIMKRRD
jgi:hypothetical protein